MLRKGLLILGGALAVLSGVGLAVDRQATMLWFLVIAAILSIGGAFVVEDDRVLGISRGAGPAVIGLGLIAVFIAGLASHQPAWAVWPTLILGFAGVALGGLLTAGRHDDLQTHAHG
jgi:hypothetical protein